MKKKNKQEKIIIPQFNPIVKTFLIFLFFFYLAATIFFFLLGDFLINYLEIDPPTENLILYSILSMIAFVNSIAALMLFAKKKLGFWFLLIFSLLATYYTAKISVIYSLIPTLIIVLVWGVLQLKKDKIKAWSILK